MMQQGDQNATAVVLLHGFMGRGADWDGVVAALGDGFDAFAPDLPGHGDTPIDAAPLSLDGWADHVVDAVIRRFRTPPVLVGYSLGARVALRIAARHRGAFSALALVSGNPGLEDATERSERAALDARRAGEIVRDFSGFRTTWYSAPLFALDGAMAEAAAAGRETNDPATMARVVRALSPGLQPPSWDVVRRLDPDRALLVVGGRDEKYVALAARIGEAMRAPPMTVVVPGAAHAVHREAPGLVADALRAWLAERSPRLPAGGASLHSTDSRNR